MERQIFLLIQIKGNLLKKSHNLHERRCWKTQQSKCVLIYLTHTHRAWWVQRAAALQSLPQQEKNNWSWAFALRQLNPLALQASPLPNFITSSLVILILSDPSKGWNVIVPWLQQVPRPQSVDYVLKVWGAFVAPQGDQVSTGDTWV